MGTAHSWSLSGSPRHILISSRSWNPTGAVHEAHAVLDDLGNFRNPLCCEILYCRMADSPLTGHQALCKQRAYRQSSVPLLWNCDLQITPRSFCRLVATWSHFDLLGVIISQSPEGGATRDSLRNSLRQDRNAMRIFRLESVFLPTDCSIFCSSAIACSSTRCRFLAMSLQGCAFLG